MKKFAHTYKTMKGEFDMNAYFNWDEVPLVLFAKDLMKILRLSRGKTYELMNSANFPTLSEGRRLFVTKEAFREWLDGKRRHIKRMPIILRTPIILK